MNKVNKVNIEKYLLEKQDLITRKIKQIRKDREAKADTHTYGMFDLDIAAHNLMVTLRLYDEAKCSPDE